MITNEQRDAMLVEYYQYGIEKREVRSYEVSLWTLQDEFITVLKWSDVEQKGRIEHPKMTLDVDGTEKFTFSIPMYYRLSSSIDENEDVGKLIENPNWYLTQSDEYLIQGLRKIKVIFNKGTSDEQIFEFVIMNITEGHENDIQTCEIETEGLAFQELGKIGYKVSLSFDNFLIQHNEWADNGKWKKSNRKQFSDEETNEPKQTLDYWCEEAGLIKLPSDLDIIDSRTWYYDVRMDWSSFKDGSNRNSDKLYEEPYTTSWSPTLTPEAVETYRIKERAVEIEKSNLYNITQTIAEKFEVFCRYEYLHDANGCITGRVIVFYNNFIQDVPSKIISFTYPYSSSKITRTMECANVTTKLHVLNVDNSTILDGYNSIMNAPPNASKEDYILNFDYMYASGAINQEQYDAIRPYEIKMSEYNKNIATIQQKKSTYETQQIELEAEKTVAENSMKIDEEQIAANQSLQNALDKLDENLDGYIQLSAATTDSSFVMTDVTGYKFISLRNTNKGIDPNSLKLFNTYYISSAGPVLADPINAFEIVYDANGNIDYIKFLNLSQLTVTVKTSINWAKIFEDCYLPQNYNGNVKLINRKIVPADDFGVAGYTNFEGTYGTVYSMAESYTASDGIEYVVVYTPIDADGTVLSEQQMTEYLQSIISVYDNIDSWKSKDAQGKKLILNIVKSSDYSNTWETDLHKKQEEWDKIRAANNWFGENANPANITIQPMASNYAPVIERLPSGKTLNDYKNNEKIETKKVYFTYRYDPHLYYKNIIKSWQIKWAEDDEKAKQASVKLGPKKDEAGYSESTGLYKQIDDLTEDLNEQLFNKHKEMEAFEQMMGPALREGYWQPENYNDYGDHNLIVSGFTNQAITSDSERGAIIGWDDELFDEEDKLYYQVGVSETAGKTYYPCIDLINVFGSINNIPTDLDEYSLVWFATNQITEYSDNPNSIKDLKILAVNSSALVKFIDESINDVTMRKPVLMITAAKTLPQEQLERMMDKDIGHARLEKYSVNINTTNNDGVVQTTVNLSHGPQNCIHNIGDNWVSNINTKNLVYPRIKFSSLDLKTNSDELNIKYNNHPLEEYVDYNIRTRDTQDPNRDSLYFLEYYITIKPLTLIKYGIGTHSFEINYVLSNANTAIYLDSLKVSQENAYPKVSYTVDVNVLNTELLHTLYNKRAQIVMINDNDLKFKDVFGYISQLELDLDQPQNDSIEVKNYKTKFEDLFSTIVAQTEEMKRNGEGFIAAANGEVPLNAATFSRTLDQNALTLQAYLDSGFDSSQVVRDRLAKIFTEAGEILAASNKSLNSMRALTLANADILAGFVQNVSAELSGQVYKSPTRPANFKPNDVWIQTDENGNVIGRYLATGFSSESSGDGTSGFVRTYDGTLASITGAAIDFNADTGIVDITAQNEINIKSGNSIYIAANENVEIIGNKKVNIGGTEINLCTLAEKKLNPITGQWEYIYNGNKISEKTTTGINLIAGAYRDDGNYASNVSRILIKPDKMELGASELEFKAASQMNFITSQGETDNTSALHISSTDGIWIGTGTNQGIRIFGGEVQLDDDGKIDMVHPTIVTAHGASVELNKDHLILGYANINTGNATAIELTDAHVIIAAGGNLDYDDWDTETNYITGDVVKYNNEYYVCQSTPQSHTWNSTNWKVLGVTGTLNGIIGARFTKDSIGFATQTDATINAIIMNNNGVMIGSSDGGIDLTTATKQQIKDYFADTSNVDRGSYVRVAADGIELGSLADLYVNTDNFKLQTHSRASSEYPDNEYIDGNTILALGAGFNTNGITGRESIADLRALAERTINPVDIRLVVNQNGAYFKGNIYASNGSFTGSVTATSFILNDNNAYTITTTYDLFTSHDTPPSGNNSFTYTSKPTTTDIDTYAKTLSNTDKEKIYLWTKITIKIGGKPQNTYTCEHINADGTTDIVKVDYTVNSTASVPSNATWSSTKPTATSEKPFLITRTRIFQNYAWVTTYTFAKLKDDTDTYTYTKSITVLYNLASSTPKKPKSKVTSTTDTTDSWTTVIPTYNNNSSYNYYQCNQIETVTVTDGIEGTPVYSWSDVIINYGLTVANAQATAASTAAAEATSLAAPITGYGLIGRDTAVANSTKDGISFDADGYPTWNNNAYGLILGNNQPKPMLIGGNDGITIVDTNGSTEQGAAVVLKGGGIALHGSTINFTTTDARTINAISLNASGITMGTNGNITLLSNNIILNSTATGTNSLFELKKKASDWTEQNNKYDTAMKYSINGGLEITGNITATSFTLQSANAYGVTKYWVINTTSTAYTSEPSNVTWTNWATQAPNLSNKQGQYLHIKLVTSIGGQSKTTYDVQYISKDGTSGFTIDGLSNNTRKLTTDGTTIIPTVELTSTYGLALGANYGVFILKNNSNALDDTYVSITSTGIKFDYNSTNYIHMDSNGIAVKGQRISINGNDVWARDDIVIMAASTNSSAPAWRKSQQSIEEYMNDGKTQVNDIWYYRGNGHAASGNDPEVLDKSPGDWVLIKPYYDAKLKFLNDQSNLISTSSSGTFLLMATDALPQFGTTDAYWIQLDITFALNRGYNVSGGTRFFSFELNAIYKDGTSQTVDLTFNSGTSVTVNGDNAWAYSDGKNNWIKFVFATGSTTKTMNINSIHMSHNYWTEDLNFFQLYLKDQTGDGQGAGSVSTMITRIELSCFCNATTSRVPCTVYYYP